MTNDNRISKSGPEVFDSHINILIKRGENFFVPSGLGSGLYSPNKHLILLTEIVMNELFSVLEEAFLCDNRRCKK